MSAERTGCGARRVKSRLPGSAYPRRRTLGTIQGLNSWSLWSRPPPPSPPHWGPGSLLLYPRSGYLFRVSPFTASHTLQFDFLKLAGCLLREEEGRAHGVKGCLASQVLTQVKRRRAWVCPVAPATSHHVPLALNGPVSVAEGTRRPGWLRQLPGSTSQGKRRTKQWSKKAREDPRDSGCWVLAGPKPNPLLLQGTSDVVSSIHAEEASLA